MTTKPTLIVMLTWNDVTVENAKEIFMEAKDAPAECWGCKMEGIEEDRLKELFACMKAAGKKTYLETLVVSQEDCQRAADLAARVGADCMVGGVYSDAILESCRANGITYAPFVGLDLRDTRLRGTVEEILADARRVEEKGVDAVGLSGFRYVSGDPVELISTLSTALKKPLLLAGGVNSCERLDVIKRISNLDAFTIGGAFFEKKFGDSFSQQIEKVCQYLNKED